MMPRRAVAAVTLALASLAGCGGTDPGAADQSAPQPVAFAVTSATVKPSGHRTLVTALRGTATPGATIEVYGRTTEASASGTWAIRADYDRDRESIPVTVSAEGFAQQSVDVPQPKRPKLRVTWSSGPTTTTDLTILRGRVRVSRGALGAVRVTVNGAPAVMTGSRWTKTVTVRRGTRRFTVRATRAGADPGQRTFSKTRTLSAAERAARAAERAARKAQREAERQARIAARKAREAAQAAAEETAASGCDPNYEGACLDQPGDYDCAGGSGDGPNYASGPITVVGSDPYDLDRDGDGVACES